MMWRFFSIVFFLVFFQLNILAQCSLKNKAFKSGESLTYVVYYTWKGMWISAGEVNFSVAYKQYISKSVFHIHAKGRTYKKFDWIFKVRDDYQTYIHANTLKPYYFKRSVQEGGFKFSNQIQFFNQKNKAKSKGKLYKITPCTHDIISALYYARNLDYRAMILNQKSKFSIFIDQDLYTLNMVFKGRTKIKTKHGTYKVIKLEPELITGKIFSDNSKMIVYVTDDQNHIPVRVKSDISVGKVIVDLKSAKGLRSESNQL